MSNEQKTCYIRARIKEHDITAHAWISLSLTDAECDVLELLIKGYTVTQISRFRDRSPKTVSTQKYQIYKKLEIRNDTTFWLDFSLSPYVKIIFMHQNKSVNGVLPLHYK
ncbi:helix-turn-helix domain-containing protein [Escherichia albertii]|uniref:LuxR C-terminal-related transcriptional regulator n=1 Tax=Escherichia albertii TaxID=208962 RepID=A0AAX3MV20_ESCAL|nr:LuxR C-terminal-related transcriptional regulator [Escherichia albertii]MCZ8653718.1 LuxR C-terminal-related transcriptional regulator [Escherichia albertii]MCZ8866969.1 LuxR C-terminal-related transcriptional regulator [Escherichia albertii]MCZ8968972.1 LuxR C-terminal-related transcriptional regulator [Escherichia albertii]WDB31969.1 LuxR C-terminal-related transcriptional regulator [Escherichia albertii]